MSIQQMLLAAGSGLPQFNVTISANTTNYNLLTVLQAAPFNYNNTYPARITLTINSAVQVASTATGTPAIITGSIISGSTLALINNGSIKGKGGAGGYGGEGPDGIGATGSAGGTALSIASSLSGKVKITNGSGEIFGGGGGGGGENGSSGTSGSGKDRRTYSEGGSGGGGGAGSGAGGAGAGASGPYDDYYNGTNGSAGTTSTFGAAGDAGAGNGGAFGSAGSAGDNAGGAAGKAIELNGGSAPTFISGNDGTHVKGAVS